MQIKSIAFTLVELIVVITILAILGTIAFISLNNLSASARDAKRISDVRSLYTKLKLENTKGVKYEDLIEVKSTSKMQINGDENKVVAQGIVNFQAIKENRDNFLDPITNTDYEVGFYEAGLEEMASLSATPRDLSLIELATINEEHNTAVVIGDYFPREEGDTPGLIKGENGEILVNEDEVIIPGVNKPEPQAIEIYGDEGDTEIRACEKWITDNIPASKGEWIWVPAREEYFINDLGERELGEGEEGYKGMDDDYYKRNVTYNDVNYICKGFAVARYEMTHDDIGIPNSTGGGGDWNTRKYSTTKEVLSIENRYPIADINQQEAITACTSIIPSIGGTNLKTHLITNNEWMTIARNIEGQATNWSDESVGSGYISNGLVNDGLHGCGPGNSKSIYKELPQLWASKTGESTDLTDTNDCNTKRQHILSTGDTIWDLSGNVWEHVNKGNNPTTSTVYDSNIIHPNVACSNAVSDSWLGYYGTDSNSIQACNFTNAYTYLNIGPRTIGLNADNGIGRIRARGSNTQSTNAYNIFLRGAYANIGAGAGIYTLHLTEISTGRYKDVGFRCSL